MDQGAANISAGMGVGVVKRWDETFKVILIETTSSFASWSRVRLVTHVKSAKGYP